MRKIIGGEKDENGIFKPMPKEPKIVASAQEPSTDVSLDDIGKRIIVAVDRATFQLLNNITAGSVDRETIGALKDCAAVLRDLKKEEKDYLSELSDEQIENLIKK